MAYLLVRHKVKDYSRWKTVFVSDKPDMYFIEEVEKVSV